VLGFEFGLVLVFVICECKNAVRGINFSIPLRLSPRHLVGFAHYILVFASTILFQPPASWGGGGLRLVASFHLK
jgi:hypothetical protein